MKHHFKALVTVAASLSLLPVYAQFGGPPGGMGGGPRGPEFSGSMGKIFGDNPAFTATMEMQTKEKSGETITMPGKIAVDEGKSRYEMDMTQMKGSKMRGPDAEQMKSMGLDRMVMISRPDKKISLMIYPGMQAYVETPLRNPDAVKPESDFKIEVTELGKDTVDGHPCVKNKVVVTDNEGKTHESTVWNATDLKNFPVKVETVEAGNTVTMLFKDVKLSKPEASEFEAPSDYKKYDNMGTMMQQEMMKRMGGGMGMPRQ